MVAPTQCTLEPTISKISLLEKNGLKQNGRSRTSSSQFVTKQSSGNRNKKRGRTVVKFATSSNQVHFIESRYHLTQEEKSNCYFQKYELDQIRWNVKSLLQKLTTNKDDKDDDSNDNNTAVVIDGNDDDEDDEMRGLESYKPGQYLAKVQRLREIRKALVKQQQMYGQLDEKWLFYNYRAMTEHSVDTARIQGHLDQQLHQESAPFQQIMQR